MNYPLRAARITRGLTLEAAGALAGLDKGQLSRIERTGGASRQTAARLAELFGLREEQILYPERFNDQKAT